MVFFVIVSFPPSPRKGAKNRRPEGRLLRMLFYGRMTRPSLRGLGAGQSPSA